MTRLDLTPFLLQLLTKPPQSLNETSHDCDLQPSLLGSPLALHVRSQLHVMLGTLISHLRSLVLLCDLFCF